MYRQTVLFFFPKQSETKSVKGSYILFSDFLKDKTSNLKLANPTFYLSHSVVLQLCFKNRNMLHLSKGVFAHLCKG